MLPEEDKEIMRQGFDTQLSEKEIERLYSFTERNAMEEFAGDFVLRGAFTYENQDDATVSREIAWVAGCFFHWNDGTG